MCRPARCRTCGKTTWAGCGRHIDAVEATVAPAQWCPGHATPSDGERRSLLARITGR